MESRRTLQRLGRGVSSHTGNLLLNQLAAQSKCETTPADGRRASRRAEEFAALARAFGGFDFPRQRNLTAGVSHTPHAVRRRTPGPSPQTLGGPGVRYPFRCVGGMPSCHFPFTLLVEFAADRRDCRSRSRHRPSCRESTIQVASAGEKSLWRSSSRVRPHFAAQPRASRFSRHYCGD
jgi:hypothetical protein